MRITGGNFRGRVLYSPHSSDVRPTQDCVREALFSMLRGDIENTRFLDLFAGSGVVGLEAMSRGAKEVVWVEGNRGVGKITRRNVLEIAGEDAAGNVIIQDAYSFIRTAGKRNGFDIVFMDPPYIDARENGLKDLAELLAKSGTLVKGGILISEMSITAPVIELEGYRLLRDRKYGKTRLLVREFLGSVIENSEERSSSDKHNDSMIKQENKP